MRILIRPISGSKVQISLRSTSAHLILALTRWDIAQTLDMHRRSGVSDAEPMLDAQWELEKALAEALGVSQSSEQSIHEMFTKRPSN